MKKLGRYAIVELLGRGGQGAVYKAVMCGPAGFRKPVALKLIRGDGLKREARIGGLLRHPNLVDVYEVGEHQGIWFAAMEYCRGGILNRYIPLPPKAVVDVGLQVCAALQYAHDELGLVHLDLKPSNLLLDGSTVKVADLGIARARGFEAGDVVRGTRGYMAPEHIRGDAVDARTDVFALGMVLERLATGRRGPDAPTVPATLDDLDAIADPDDWLAPIRRRAMQRDPADRFQSMAELAHALRELHPDGPGLAEVVTRRTRAAYQPGATERTNLAADRDPFVGRDRELVDLAGELERPGVVLLKGPGGIGKTRLARRAALAYHQRTDEQAWFVDLSEAETRTGLLNALARALSVTLGRTSPAQQVDQLGHALTGRGRAVVVLDTLEHLAQETDVLERLIAHAPQTRFLITSRVTLGLGEVVFELEPLSEGDGVALLAARALARGHHVADDPALTEIAGRLDGLPFALELAASRIGVLSPTEVLEHLGLSWLRSGRRTHDRQTTLRSTLDWSWELLDPAERTALSQLSVFHGGFEVQAAEEVLDIPHQPFVLDLLGALSDASWLSWRDDRFRMLESARSYAAERLDDAGEASRRHRAYFAALGRPGALAVLNSGRGLQLRRRLSRELDNLVAACRRALAEGEPEIAACCACAAWAVLYNTGPMQAGLELLQQVIELDGPPTELRARTSIAAGTALLSHGRMGQSEEVLHEALGIASALDDPLLRGDALRALGNLYWRQSRTRDAEQVLRESIELHRSLRNRTGEALALSTLALLVEQVGEMRMALALFERSLEVHRANGDRRNEGIVLGNLGNLHYRLGDATRSRELLELAREAHEDCGARRSVGIVLGNLGVTYGSPDEADVAQELYERALAIHREVGDRRFEALMLVNLANITAGHRGDFARAELLARQSVEIHRELGQPRQLGFSLGVLGRLKTELGQLDEARALSDEAIDLLRENHHDLVRVLCYRAELDAIEGREEDARDCLERARGLIESMGLAPGSDLHLAMADATGTLEARLEDRRAR